MSQELLFNNVLSNQNPKNPVHGCAGVAGCAVIAEGSAMVAFGYGFISLGSALVLHLIILLWIGHWAYRQKDSLFPLMLAFKVAVMGPLGASLIILAIPAYHFYSRRSVNFMEWFASLFPEDTTKESDILYERITFGLDENSDIHNIEPFQHVLSYGTFQQKQMVLAKIAQYYRPEFAPILWRAVNDPDNAIRVQAATVIAKKERDYIKHYLELEKVLRQTPDDLSKQNALAKACEAYADSGLLDPDSQHKYYNKAIEIYENCEAQYNEEVIIALARLYLRQGKLEKAKKQLKLCLQQKTSPRAALVLMETFFHEHAFDEVRILARTHWQQLTANEDIVEDIKEEAVLVKPWSLGLSREILVVAQ